MNGALNINIMEGKDYKMSGEDIINIYIILYIEKIIITKHFYC